MWWWVGLGVVYVGRQGMSRYVYYQSYLRQFCDLALHIPVLGHEFLNFLRAAIVMNGISETVEGGWEGVGERHTR